MVTKGNHRLGEFLKELGLTEGRCTGIPTIQEELRANGSPAATIETDDARTYFIIDIPCHPDFSGKVLEIKNFGKCFAKDVVKDVVIKASTLVDRFSVDMRTIQRNQKVLQELGLIAHEGGRKDGLWIVIQKTILSD